MLERIVLAQPDEMVRELFLPPASWPHFNFLPQLIAPRPSLSLSLHYSSPPYSHLILTLHMLIIHLSPPT